MADFSMVAEELKQLKGLFDKGLLSEAEFQIAKEQILSNAGKSSVVQRPEVTEVSGGFPRKKGKGKVVGAGILSVAVVGGLTVLGAKSGVLDLGKDDSKKGIVELVEEEASGGEFSKIEGTEVASKSVMDKLVGTWYSVQVQDNIVALSTLTFKSDDTIVQQRIGWQINENYSLANIAPTEYEINSFVEEENTITFNLSYPTYETIENAQFRINYDESRTEFSFERLDIDGVGIQEFSCLTNDIIDDYQELDNLLRAELVDFLKDTFGEKALINEEPSSLNGSSADVNSTKSNENFFKDVRDYIFVGQWEKGLSSAEAFIWNQKFFDRLDLEALYQSYLEEGNPVEDTFLFVEYITLEAPVMEGWEELTISILKEELGDEFSGFKRIEVTENEYGVFGRIIFEVDDKEIAYQTVSARTGYRHG